MRRFSAVRRRTVGVCLALAGALTACAACAAPPASTLAADAADPDIVLDAASYVLHTTNSPYGNVPTWISPDLKRWTWSGDALPTLPSWAAPGWTWAPSAIQRPDGRWVLYFSAAVRGRIAPNGQPLKCVGVATAPGSTGPFAVPTAAPPLLCQSALGGDIDPSPYRAPDGVAYLVTKVDGNAARRPTMLQSRRLAADLTSFAPGPAVTLLTSTTAPGEAGVVEAPDLVRTAAALTLLYSAGDYAAATYSEAQAACPSPVSACRRISRLLDPAVAGRGAGGASGFTDRGGVSRLAWHAYLTSGSSRRSLLVGTLAPGSAGSVTLGRVGALRASPAPAVSPTAVLPTDTAELTVPARTPVTVPGARTRG